MYTQYKHLTTGISSSLTWSQQYQQQHSNHQQYHKFQPCSTNPGLTDLCYYLRTLYGYCTLLSEDFRPIRTSETVLEVFQLLWRFDHLHHNLHNRITVFMRYDSIIATFETLFINARKENKPSIQSSEPFLKSSYIRIQFFQKYTTDSCDSKESTGVTGLNLHP